MINDVVHIIVEMCVQLVFGVFCFISSGDSRVCPCGRLFSLFSLFFGKNIINKIECCSVDNLQSLLSIIAAKMKSMIYQK